jgi:hypothetical protein
MSVPRSPLGFYGNDTDLSCAMSSGRIWLVEQLDEGASALRELRELPRVVESYQGVLTSELE